VQGVGSVGVTPQLKAAFAQALETAYGLQLPEAAGLDTFASLEAMGEGRIRTALYFGGNLYGASPAPEWTARCMQNVDTAIYVSTKLNPGHFHGCGRTTLILPARTRDEEMQSTTQESMFNYVRLSDGGARALSPEMRSEVEIVATLAARVLPPGPIEWERWKNHATLRREMARVVPGFAALGDIDASKREFTIEGRIRHEPHFGTSDGRARFHVIPLPEFPLQEGELRLMTLRSEGQFNTVVYEHEDVYRGATRRDVVFMHESDGGRLGLQEGETVRLRSEAGVYGPVRVLFADIRSGNLAVYYPEANVLVPRRLDRRSRTPVFKSVAVCVEPVESPSGPSPLPAGATAGTISRSGERA
jgi:anaerobic selenocysteine-containing dehydrogenase